MFRKKQYQRRIDCKIVKKNHICSFEDRTSAGTPASTICPCMDAWAAMLDNYGRIGYAIAHEFGHGFDSNGTLYDETGAMNPWISAEDNDGSKCF